MATKAPDVTFEDAHIFEAVLNSIAEHAALLL